MGIGSTARIANVVLGIWLFISTFAWPHTSAQMVNAALVGLFIALTALSALSADATPRLRLVNAALGLWLLVSIGAFPTQSLATKLESAVVGVLVFALALVPQRPGRVSGRTTA